MGNQRSTHTHTLAQKSHSTPAMRMNQKPQEDALGHLQELGSNRAVNEAIAQHEQNLQSRHNSQMTKPTFRGLSHELASTSQQYGLVIQPKLVVGAPNDKYEQEADRVAAQVVQQLGANQPQSLALPTPVAQPLIQRMPNPEDLFKEEEPPSAVDIRQSTSSLNPTARLHEKARNEVRKIKQHKEKRIKRKDLVFDKRLLMKSTSTTDAAGYPVLKFTVADEEHSIFVKQQGNLPILMIASLPLPIATFIVDLDTRFDSLMNQLKDNASKGMRRLGTDKTRTAYKTEEFNPVKQKAITLLSTATATFANISSTAAQKLNDEEALAKQLGILIKKVRDLADRIGKHFANPEGYNKGVWGKGFDYFVKNMGEAVERYNIEGLVARYAQQPDYGGAKFERDHQPHNALLVAVAQQPEFKGKQIETAAGGAHSEQAWTIMLHETRHDQGRTWGAKGGAIVTQFHNDLANERSRLGAVGPVNPQDVIDYCIEYLVDALIKDVTAMKVVVNADANYGDIDSLGLDAMETKKLKADIKQQILDGEDRMLTTEGSIRTYGT